MLAAPPMLLFTLFAPSKGLIFQIVPLRLRLEKSQKVSCQAFINVGVSSSNIQYFYLRLPSSKIQNCICIAFFQGLKVSLVICLSSTVNLACLVIQSMVRGKSALGELRQQMNWFSSMRKRRLLVVNPLQDCLLTRLKQTVWPLSSYLLQNYDISLPDILYKLKIAALKLSTRSLLLSYRSPSQSIENHSHSVHSNYYPLDLPNLGMSFHQPLQLGSLYSSRVYHWPCQQKSGPLYPQQITFLHYWLVRKERQSQYCFISLSSILPLLIVNTPQRSDIPSASTPHIEILYLDFWEEITLIIEISVVKIQSELYLLFCRIHRLSCRKAITRFISSSSNSSEEAASILLWYELTISLIFYYLCCFSQQQLFRKNAMQTRLQSRMQQLPYLMACRENYFQKFLN